jgi:anti-sigma factor RsiW
MNEPFHKDLVEAAWRRQLSSEEKAALASFLALHPEKQTEWGEDLALTEILRQLPQPQVSSNFTARTLEALAAELRHSERSASRAPRWLKWTHRLTPRYAVAVLLVMGSILGVFEYRIHDQKRRVTQEMVSTLGRAAAVLPAPELLQDFDSIQLLGSVSTPSDEDLLAVLEK